MCFCFSLNFLEEISIKKNKWFHSTEGISLIASFSVQLRSVLLSFLLIVQGFRKSAGWLPYASSLIYEKQHWLDQEEDACCATARARCPLRSS
jgi:hypothetical protein